MKGTRSPRLHTVIINWTHVVAFLAALVLLSEIILIFEQLQVAPPDCTANGVVVSDQPIWENVPPKAALKKLNDGYYTDAQHVYLFNVDQQYSIPHADPKTFVVYSTAVDGTPFAKDAHYVFYDGIQLLSADPQTFTPLSPDIGTYGKDAHHVYWRWEMLPCADPASFVALPWDFGKDKNSVYSTYAIMSEADVSTFVSFNEQKMCGKNCFYNAEDKNHKYFADQIVQ